MKINGIKYNIRGRYKVAEMKKIYSSFQTKYPTSNLTFQQWAISRGKVVNRVK